MFDEKMNSLHERMQKARAEAIDALEGIDREEDPSESLIAERMEQHDKFMADYDRYEEQAKRYQRQIEIDARSAIETDEPEVESHQVEPEVDSEERYMRCFEKVVRRGLSSLPHEDVAFMEERALSVGTNAKGGFLVPESVATTIVEQMEHYTPFLNSNVFTTLNTPHGREVNYPTTNDTANDATLVAENAAVTEQDAAIGEVPINAYKYSSNLVKVSNELIMDSAIPIGTILASLFAKRMGRGVGTSLTTGTGSSQPQGIVTGASAAFTTASATALTSDEVIRAQQSLDHAYEGNPGVRWMMSRGIQTHIRTLKDSDNRYLWSAGDMRSGTPAELLGVEVILNPAMDGTVASAKKTLLYGDMASYLVRNAGGARFMRLDERFADSDSVGFLYFQRFDGAVLDSAGLKLVTQKT